MERLNLLPKISRYLVIKLIYFGRNSGIHGLKYVFEEKGTKLSRIIWLLILLSFTGCFYLQLMPVIQRSDEINFTPDTRYLHWNTTFPAITVCETYNPKTVLHKLEALYPNLLESLNFDYKRYVAGLIYGRGVCSRTLCNPCGTSIPCDVQWREIIEKIHRKCNEMITDCRFNNEEIACCKHFGMVDSEYGTCFSFNSLQAQNLDSVQFVVNRTTGPGVLSFRLLYDAQITIHSPEELSTNILDKELRFDVITHVANFVTLMFSTIGVDNDPLLQFEDIDARRCRYNNEIPNEALHTYKIYSYGACQLTRKLEKSFEHCRCVHPVRDLNYKHLYCNYTGLNCLTTYEALKTKINKDVIDEDCLPSCNENDISTIYISKRWINNDLKGSLVNIKMASLPTLLYKKNLICTNMDLVVTVGGLLGLFFSASILSLVEIFYLLLRKQNK